MNIWKCHIHKSPHNWRTWYIAWGLWQPFKHCGKGGWFDISIKPYRNYKYEKGELKKMYDVRLGVKQLLQDIGEYFPLLSKKIIQKPLPEKPEKKLYLVETSSIHKIKYVVECEPDKITDLLEWNDVGDDLTVEYDQQHISEKVVYLKELDGEEHFLCLFEEDDHYLKGWSREQKLGLINRK